MKRLREIKDLFKREFKVYRLVLRDARTPRTGKILLGLAIGYALLPFDLIPDFIPIVGHLDDLVIVPLLVYWALKTIPPKVIEDCRRQAGQDHPRPGNS